MHITRFTDLSLRVLMYLCARPSQDRTTVTEIAERIGWTRNHVVKVVHRLSQEGSLLSAAAPAAWGSIPKPESSVWAT